LAIVVGLLALLAITFEFGLVFRNQFGLLLKLVLEAFTDLFLLTLELCVLTGCCA